MTAAIILTIMFGLSVLVIITCEDNEGKDEWLTGIDETERGTATVVGRKNKDGSVTIVHSSYEPKEPQ